jgi:hypothetical protein
MSFEFNAGQSHPEVKYQTRGRGYHLLLARNEAVLALRHATCQWPQTHRKGLNLAGPACSNPEFACLRMRLVKANPAPPVAGLEELPGKVNYFRGKDPVQWRTRIATFAKVKYEAVYPGIDQVFYGQQGQLEYDFVVAPGADPGSIKLRFEGTHDLEMDAEGNLVISVPGGQVRQRKPTIYQVVEGVRREISGGYCLEVDCPRGTGLRTWTVGFQIGAYDPTWALIIDPVLVYSTYLGGINDEDSYDIAVDATGSPYITGATPSPNFAVGGTPWALGPNGGTDAFVAKLSPDGAGLVYLTYLGGTSSDVAYGIAVNSSGHAFVGGSTRSDDFPVTSEAFQKMLNGGLNAVNSDAFVTKLSSDGASLIYSTYLGGQNTEDGLGIALDGNGRAYLVGSTDSTDFPHTLNAYQPMLNGGLNNVSLDAFVTKLTPDGASLVYSTYLGGATTRIAPALDWHSQAASRWTIKTMPTSQA